MKKIPEEILLNQIVKDMEKLNHDLQCSRHAIMDFASKKEMLEMYKAIKESEEIKNEMIKAFRQ